MVMFDLTSYPTWKHVRDKWLHELAVHYHPEDEQPPVVILVGTKNDMEMDVRYKNLDEIYRVANAYVRAYYCPTLLFAFGFLYYH